MKHIFGQFVEEFITSVLPLQRLRIRNVRRSRRTGLQRRELCCRRISEVHIVSAIVNTSNKIRDVVLAHVSPKKLTVL